MSAQYTQGAKRQKVKEGKSEMVDYFQGMLKNYACIDKVEYNNMATLSDTASYRYYNSAERVHSRAMEEWLKCSLSLTEFKSFGSDQSKSHRPWDDNTNSLDNYKRCIKALFDFCTKLGIKYWTAFDSDLVPQSDNWEENRGYWDEIVEFVQELSTRYNIKLLWLAPNLHSHIRYTSGALTSNEATTFTQAASQIKKCIEISQRLNAECFLLWPCRERYDSIFQSDVARELKLFAKLLKITADYKDRLNYRCQLLIMPYYSCNFRDYSGNSRNYRAWSRRENDSVHMYMWDVTSCLYFLRNYNLERYYKVCSTPGHHMYMANVYNMLGGVTVTNDFDQYNSKKLTLMMKCIVDQGTTPPGGINLKLTPSRDSDLRELVTSHVKYIDAIAKALRVACSVIAEQVFSKHVQQRYATYCSGFGSRLVSGEVSVEECEEYHKKHQNQSEASSKSEHLDAMFQRYIDACDHV